jgi:hypothetical protein
MIYNVEITTEREWNETQIASVVQLWEGDFIAFFAKNEKKYKKRNNLRLRSRKKIKTRSSLITPL